MMLIIMPENEVVCWMLLMVDGRRRTAEVGGG